TFLAFTRPWVCKIACCLDLPLNSPSCCSAVTAPSRALSIMAAAPCGAPSPAGNISTIASTASLSSPPALTVTSIPILLPPFQHHHGTTGKTRRLCTTTPLSPMAAIRAQAPLYIIGEAGYHLRSRFANVHSKPAQGVSSWPLTLAVRRRLAGLD